MRNQNAVAELSTFENLDTISTIYKVAAFGLETDYDVFPGISNDFLINPPPPISAPVPGSDYTRGGTQDGKDSFTVNEAAAQITRYSYSMAGYGMLNTPAAITYAFRETSVNMPSSVSGFNQFNAQQILMTELALSAWADVANLFFVRISNVDSNYSDSAQMLFGNYTTGQAAAAAFAYYPFDLSAGSVASDVWVNSSLSYMANPQLLNYGMTAILHEIGHALGLAHPGDYNAGNGAPTYATDAVYHEDSRQFSVMSYWSETNTGANFNFNYASAPLMDDIAAIQRLYGTRSNVRQGNTIYGFNSNADKVWYQITSATQKVIFCAWDTGGIDTFDFSGYSSSSVIDLVDTHFSSVNGMVGNVSIAQGVAIENAITGNGNDYVYGNSLANNITTNGGDDVLDGAGGADRMYGGAGNDAYFVDNIGDLVIETIGGVDATGIDTVNSSINYTLGAYLENLTLIGSGAINAIGNSLTNTIIGNEATNSINGALGADFMYGRGGNDTYTVDNIGDVASEEYNVGVDDGGVDTVRANVNYTLNNYIENLSLTGTSAINGTGNSSNNTISGNSSANILIGLGGNDMINGYAGADTMYGGAGNDSYTIDNIGDIISEETVLGVDDGGVDKVSSTLSYSLGNYVESLILLGSANINGIGNSLNNNIIGNNGANKITGGSGNDKLSGGLGNDVYFFEAGFGIDTVTETGGADTITFGSGLSAGDIITETIGADVYYGIRELADPSKTASQVANRIRIVGGASGAGVIEAINYAASPTPSIGNIAQAQGLIQASAQFIGQKSVISLSDDGKDAIIQSLIAISNKNHSSGIFA